MEDHGSTSGIGSHDINDTPEAEQAASATDNVVEIHGRKNASAKAKRAPPPHEATEDEDEDEGGDHGQHDDTDNDDVPPINKAGAIAWLNSRYCVVREGGHTIVFANRYDSLLHRNVYDRISFDDFRRMFLNRVVKVIKRSDKGKVEAVINVGEMWLRSALRRQFINGVIFDPSGTQRPGVLNLWRGFGVQPKPGDWGLLHDHITNVICRGSEQNADYVVKWMAHLVQNPDSHGQVALVFRGLLGSGKGVVFRALQRIVGDHSLYIQSPEHLVGRFNSHLREVIFCFADEAFYAGDRQHTGILKAIVTEESITTERKYQDAGPSAMFMRLGMASNEKWVVPAALEERRFCVLDVASTHIGNHAYFAAIAKQLENGGYEAMLYDLLHIDLSDFNIRDFPKTEALDEQKKQSMATELRWWLDVLHRGYAFTSRLGLEEFFAQWLDPISMELLVQSYAVFAKDAGERHKLSREDLGRFMATMGGKAARPRTGLTGEAMRDIADILERIGRRAVAVQKKRPHSYQWGGIAAARQKFIDATKLSVDWPDETPDDPDVDAAP